MKRILIKALFFLCNHNKYVNKCVHKFLIYKDSVVFQSWTNRLIMSEPLHVQWKCLPFSLAENLYIKDEKSPDVISLKENGEKWWGGKIFNNTPFEAQMAPEPQFEYELTPNSIAIHSTEAPGQWIYLSTKYTLPESYAIEFDFLSFTEISEHLQIDIFAISLSRRIQLIFSHNREFIINSVDHSLFISPLFKVPFTIPLNVNVKIRLEIIKSRFAIFVDGKLLTCQLVDRHKFIPSRLFLLFWNENEKIEIYNKISNFKYYEISSKQ